MSFSNRPAPPSRYPPDVEARLYLQLVPLTRFLAKKMTARNPLLSAHAEDLLSEAQCGALHAVRVYDQNKGNLSTIAYNWIRAYMQSYITKCVYATNSRDYNRNNDRGEGDVDALSTEPNDGTSSDDYDDVVRTLSDSLERSVGQTNAKIWVDRYLGRTMEQIGQDLGITKQAVGLRIKRTEKKAQKALDFVEGKW